MSLEKAIKEWHEGVITQSEYYYQVTRQQRHRGRPSTSESRARKEAKRRKNLRTLVSFMRKNSASVLRDLKFASKDNDFVKDIRSKMITKPHYFLPNKNSNITGLSEKQTSAVVRCAEGRRKYLNQIEKSAKEFTGKIPRELEIGRVTIEGEIISMKMKDTAYGQTLKIMLKCGNAENGFWKLYGTMPIIKEEEEQNGKKLADVGVSIKFDAKVKISDNDPSFGFFSRPTKGQLSINPTQFFDQLDEKVTLLKH
jgi:hypothetical protein